MAIERRKLLFIDRDGTLIKECPPTYQIDNWAKLEFYPAVFTYMTAIAKFDFELVMVTNQDGLGTSTFPEEQFWPIQEHIIDCFSLRGVHFTDVHIDKSFPHENLQTRKPGTGMLKKYFDEQIYDLQNSFVIGDRLTDVQLANNLGCRAILFNYSEMIEENHGYDMEELRDVIAFRAKSWRNVYLFLLRERGKRLR